MSPFQEGSGRATVCTLAQSRSHDVWNAGDKSYEKGYPPGIQADRHSLSLWL
jgi:hypothetical protein